ncbi:MAG: hypothetical protein HOV66_05510, partial [Streptomycetaceae bacterium]|nr:hypothetical protein [Streptomycetaceae bacterium]
MLANRFVRSRTATVPLLAGALFAVAGCTDSGSGGSAKAPSPSATSPAQEDETEGSAKDEPVGADYWTAKADVGIFLCGKPDAKQDSCADGEVTGAPRDSITQDLKRMPEVDRVFYENGTEAYRHFASDPKNAAAAAGTTADQFPEAFRVKLKDPAKEDALRAAFEGRPGVRAVVGPPKATPKPTIDPRSTWYGKIDLTVFLCAKSDPKRGGCANGDVSAAERDAIRTDLQRNPAVKQLSYESKQDAYTDFKRTAPDSPVAEVLTAEQFSEAFRTDLADRKD